jgi:methyltransferase
MFLLVLLTLAFLPMAFEARLAARHDRALRSAGAFEPGDDVFPLMQIAYPACFLAMAVEAAVRGARVNLTWGAGLVIFVLAKAIKYWAIATLGPRWTFRVLVPPASSRIISGPYRFMRHPNYAGVIGELAGMGMMAQAPVSGVLSVVVFVVIIVARIRVEERALASSGNTGSGMKKPDARPG